MFNLLFYRKQISPDREAIFDYDAGVRYSYGDLYDRAGALSAFLVKECGLKKGDCVALAGPNHPVFFEAFFSSLETGIIVTTYNHHLCTEELVSLVRDEAPKVLFYGGDMRDKVPALREQTGIEHYIAFTEDALPGDEVLGAVLGRNAGMFAEADRAVLDPEDIQMYLHTGGTTGRPKAAMISYRALFYNCVSDVFTNALSMEDSAVVLLPLFHTSGWNIIALPLLTCGGRVILTRSFHSEVILRIIREERPTVGMTVPTIYKRLSEHPDFEKTDFSSYKWLSSGGATVQNQVMEAFWARGIRLANGYGMTEIGPHNMTMPLLETPIEKLREKKLSVGKPMFFNNIRIVDDNGRDVKDGEVGELLFSGPLVFSGYLNRPEETEKVMIGGWVHTGDMAWKDDEGFYYIAGRKKHMFICGGENIFGAEIEAVIGGYEGIRDVTVIGVPDPTWGEVGKAIVVTDDKDFNPDALKTYIRGFLSTIKVPKYIKVVNELPLNEAGKKNMPLIRELYGTAD